MKTGRVLDTATTTQRKRARDGRMLARNKDDLQLQVRHWSQHSLAEPAKNLSPFAAACSHPGRPAAEPAKRYYVVGSSFVFSLLC